MDKVKLPERFASKINFTSDCWLWTASKVGNGYGQFRTNGNLILAHRYSWKLHHGEIPKSLNVLHKCDVRSCVNPDHLFLGTYRDNAHDMFSKDRGFTPKGEKHGKAKLTQIKVDEIRKLYVRGTNVKSEYSQAGLARRYGVTPGHIDRIVNRKLWKLEVSQ